MTEKTPARGRRWRLKLNCKIAGRRQVYDVVGWWRKFATCGWSERGRKYKTKRRPARTGVCQEGSKGATETGSFYCGAKTSEFPVFRRRLRGGFQRKWWRRWRTWRGCGEPGLDPEKRDDHAWWRGLRRSGGGWRGRDRGLWRWRGRTRWSPMIGCGSNGSWWLMGVGRDNRLKCWRWSSSLTGDDDRNRSGVGLRQLQVEVAEVWSWELGKEGLNEEYVNFGDWLKVRNVILIPSYLCILWTFIVWFILIQNNIILFLI